MSKQNKEVSYVDQEHAVPRKKQLEIPRFQHVPGWKSGSIYCLGSSGTRGQRGASGGAAGQF